MSVSVDISYISLNKHHEELCGDKVEILKTEDSNIVILADGMGSGVKANILATLTSKILGTMFRNGASIDECVETIVKTLPVCQVRQVAYSTFSILQIFHTGEVYLVEFDNPACVFVRDGKINKLPSVERIIEGKIIKESRFRVKPSDSLVLMSDGAIHAGVGKILNYGWTWESVAEYTVEAASKTVSASRLAAMLSKACDDLYMQLPGDDTTIAAVRIINSKPVTLFTGPPLNDTDDINIVRELMKGQTTRIICGGTSANIAARVLHKKIETSLNYTDPSLPPIAKIVGIDLVTEGVLTLTRALALMRRYNEDQIDEKFFDELDLDNGGSMIAKVIIESCTDLTLLVGKAINEAHQNPGLPFDLSIRMKLIDEIKIAATLMGKNVTVKYY
ncbi:MAG: protein serine/threonine phosphatase [Clostridiales bacterium]|jgi:hypothetical protein|nr:protein serine/threonine phosphatase [Clostridiales bacterium]